jgi:hypothetical protein
VPGLAVVLVERFSQLLATEKNETMVKIDGSVTESSAFASFPFFLWPTDAKTAMILQTKRELFVRSTCL